MKTKPEVACDMLYEFLVQEGILFQYLEMIKCELGADTLLKNVKRDFKLNIVHGEDARMEYARWSFTTMRYGDFTIVRYPFLDGLEERWLKFFATEMKERGL